MARLMYVVDVDTGDDENDEQYLAKLRETFRLISEDLSAWGFAGESFSISDISEDKHSMGDAMAKYIAYGMKS